MEGTQREILRVGMVDMCDLVGEGRQMSMSGTTSPSASGPTTSRSLACSAATPSCPRLTSTPGNTSRLACLCLPCVAALPVEAARAVYRVPSNIVGGRSVGLAQYEDGEACWLGKEQVQKRPWSSLS